MNRGSAALGCGLVMLIAVAPIFPIYSMATESREISWGNFPKVCDLADGAPIGDLCFGFVDAVMEIVRFEEVAETDNIHHLYANACVPFGTTVGQAMEKMRPWLRTHHSCAGKCNATGYVYEGLEVAYPCGQKP